MSKIINQSVDELKIKKLDEFMANMTLDEQVKVMEQTTIVANQYKRFQHTIHAQRKARYEVLENMYNNKNI